jgi:hypothetical protein
MTDPLNIENDFIGTMTDPSNIEGIFKTGLFFSTSELKTAKFNPSELRSRLRENR